MRNGATSVSDAGIQRIWRRARRQRRARRPRAGARSPGHARQRSVTIELGGEDSWSSTRHPPTPVQAVPLHARHARGAVRVHPDAENAVTAATVMRVTTWPRQHDVMDEAGSGGVVREFPLVEFGGHPLRRLPLRHRVAPARLRASTPSPTSPDLRRAGHRPDARVHCRPEGADEVSTTCGDPRERRPIASSGTSARCTPADEDRRGADALRRPWA